VTGRGIVVDASVARGSGNVTTEAALSLRCRDVLVAIERYEHRVVISDDIRREWRAHASKYSWLWLTNMISRNRHVAVDPNADEELRKAIDSLPEDERQAARKDLLLTEAALDSDRCVISLDKEMREILHRVAQELPRIGAINWVNPESDKCLPWIIAGAPDDPDLQLFQAVHRSHRNPRPRTPDQSAP
jgi:hypothetical protein